MRSFRRAALLAFAVCALASGCRQRSADAPTAAGATAPPSESPAEAALRAAVAKARFEPPSDGTLNDDQIEMYLRVRTREREDRAQPGGPPVVEVDLLAAQEVHANPKEFQWVKARVLEAKAAGAARLLLQQMGPIEKETIARLKAQREATADAAEQARIDAQIRDLESGEKRASAEITPAAQHNAELLARYADRLNEVERRPLNRSTPATAGGSPVT